MALTVDYKALTMKSESILKRLAYFNRNDPRVWIYKSEKSKLFGVTLNFAKRGAWAVLLAIIAVVGFLAWGATWIGAKCLLLSATQELLYRIAVVVTTLAFVALCFGMAERDLKRHPGPKSARSC